MRVIFYVDICAGGFVSPKPSHEYYCHVVVTKRMCRWRGWLSPRRYPVMWYPDFIGCRHVYVAIASSVPSNGVSNRVSLLHVGREVTWPRRHLARISSGLVGTRRMMETMVCIAFSLVDTQPRCRCVIYHRCIGWCLPIKQNRSRFLAGAKSIWNCMGVASSWGVE